jgi:phosphohistidine phosphatase SixA
MLGMLLTLTNIHAQRAANAATTIILMRHAEKELTSDDPPLSAAGKRRAEKLPVWLKKYRPDEFYSTATIRTRQTLEPWARKAGKQIQIYNAATQQTLAKSLKQKPGKTIVVVGHSNTIPQLVNLLIGTNTYSDLPDNEFGKVWIISIKGGKTTVDLRKF